MAKIEPLFQEASAQLLSIVSSLAAGLHPLEGGRTKLVERCVDDVQKVMADVGSRLPKDVRERLASVTSSLTPSGSSAPLPYSQYLDAVSLLTESLRLLAKSASPLPLPASPILRLPAELVAHIVSYCQVDDRRLRQNMNLALASTCRVLHVAVQPILAAEVHLFTPGQLERIWRKAKDDAKGELCVRELTVDLNLREIRHQQSSGRWAGRLLPPLVRLFGRSETFKTLHLRFFRQAKTGTEEDSIPPDNEAIYQALGLSNLSWAEFSRFRDTAPHLCELHMPSLSPHADARTTSIPLFDPPTSLRILRIGHIDTPSRIGPSELLSLSAVERDRARQEKRRGFRQVWKELQVVSLPWHVLSSMQLNRLVRPYKTLRVSAMTNLEITVSFAETSQPVELDETFAHLAPTLRRLALRTRTSGLSESQRQDIVTALDSGIGQLRRLQHLELGGNLITNDMLARGTALPYLKHLILLPMRSPFDYPDFPSTIASFPLHLRSVGLCTPKRPDWRVPEFAISHIMDACADKGLDLHVEERDKESNMAD